MPRPTCTRGHALLDRDAKAAVEQQVFGRITRERKLRQHQQVGIEFAAGALGRGDNASRIARDIAHEHVQLPEGDAQFVGSVHRAVICRAAPSSISS